MVSLYFFSSSKLTHTWNHKLTLLFATNSSAGEHFTPDYEITLVVQPFFQGTDVTIITECAFGSWCWVTVCWKDSFFPELHIVCNVAGSVQFITNFPISSNETRLCVCWDIFDQHQSISHTRAQHSRRHKIVPGPSLRENHLDFQCNTQSSDVVRICVFIRNCTIHFLFMKRFLHDS